ncbi:hypothetical protein MY8738_002437 [Beauveria namnaoensis]
MNVSRGFHEKFPRVNLDDEQVQIIAQLSMEAIYKNQNELVTEKGGHGGEPSASSQQTSLPIIDSETQNVESPAAKVIENLISASHARFLEAISDVIPPIRDQPHDLGSLAWEKTAMVLHKAIDHLPPFEDAKVLIDTFFTFVESNCPIEQSSTTYKWACSKQESSRLSIPAYLAGAQESLFRPHAHLNIVYNLNWVAIGRGALLRLVRRQIRPSTADNMSLGDDGTHLRSQELAHRCTEAASTITDWIVQLQSRNLLAKFSFMDLHACSSAVIILLLNVLLHPDNHQLLAISHGIDALRFMAGGSMLATKALRLAERLQQGVYQATGLAYEEIIPSQPPLFTPTISQHFSHESTLGAERNAFSLAALDDGVDDHVAQSATPLDLDIFTDLETFFLDCSEQNRHLFGFDGFESAFGSEGV